MQTLKERDANAAVQQETINALVDAGVKVADIRAAVERVAGAEHEGFAQYAGYWSGDEWALGLVTSTIRTKRGTAFRRGDIVLFTARGAVAGDTTVTAYSIRNGVNTSLRATDVDALATTTLYRHERGLVTLTGAA